MNDDGWQPPSSPLPRRLRDRVATGQSRSFVRLRSLDLSGEALVALPPILKDFANLATLDLRNNHRRAGAAEHAERVDVEVGVLRRY